MPVIKSAKKKLRQDRKRTLQNKRWETLLKDLLKKVKKNPTQELIRRVTQVADKSVKKHILPKNKAARIKSSLAKLTVDKTLSTTTQKVGIKKKTT